MRPLLIVIFFSQTRDVIVVAADEHASLFSREDQLLLVGQAAATKIAKMLGVTLGLSQQRCQPFRQVLVQQVAHQRSLGGMAAEPACHACR